MMSLSLSLLPLRENGLSGCPVEGDTGAAGCRAYFGVDEHAIYDAVGGDLPELLRYGRCVCVVAVYVPVHGLNEPDLAVEDLVELMDEFEADSAVKLHGVQPGLLRGEWRSPGLEEQGRPRRIRRPQEDAA